MRRVVIWLTGVLLALVVTACSAGSDATSAISHQGQIYRDSAGWTIVVPRGWHVAQFSDSKNGITSAGVQLSNVPLPAPALIPGYPIQVDDLVLPARGVALIIATDSDPKLSHGTVAVPLLPAPNGRYWTVGSARAGAPYMQTLWFRFKGTTFIACAKIGPKATSGNIQAVASIIHSLR